MGKRQCVHCGNCHLHRTPPSPPPAWSHSLKERRGEMECKGEELWARSSPSSIPPPLFLLIFPWNAWSLLVATRRQLWNSDDFIAELQEGSCAGLQLEQPASCMQDFSTTLFHSFQSREWEEQKPEHCLIDLEPALSSPPKQATLTVSLKK